MCMFSRSVRSVSGTSIFMHELGNGNHSLVYSMKLDTLQAVAMILPVPVKRGSGDDALTFINLQKYPEFFDDLAKCFPQPRSRGLRSRSFEADSFSLKVHDVGDFIASYVPAVADFDRLNEIFRLPSTIWDELPSYQEFGFAVFQLKESDDEKTIHPMAFRYPAENESELFFPTFHIHDGEIEKEAEYDHFLYFQRSNSFLDPEAQFELGAKTPGETMQTELAQGVINSHSPVFRHRIVGNLSNCDHVLRASKNKTTLKRVLP